LSSKRSGGAIALPRELWRRRELALILVQRNLKIRYKSSVLGFFWTLLGPLLLILIYALFLGVLRVPIELPVLVTGIVAWQFLAMCLGDSLHAVVGNANLVTKAAFPRILLPLSMMKANLVNFLLSLLVVAGYLLCVRVSFGPVLLCVPALVTHAALCFGVALLFSCANVFFRDTEHILSVVMLAWFFMSPVIYPIETLLGNPDFPAWVHMLYFCNPMAGIVTACRNIFLTQDFVAPSLWGLSFLTAWLVLAAGVFLFQRTEPRFGDEL